MDQRRESSRRGWWIKDKDKKVNLGSLIAKEFGDAVAAPIKLQYPPRERSHPPILQLKSGFFDIYNSIKLFSN